MHAMAEAILEYRRMLGVLGRAVDLAKAGAPVALIGPGPLCVRGLTQALACATMGSVLKGRFN